MSDKLYLIRVDMERFLGPMTLREVREAFRRMEFGLQDEIASSNKAWVPFDDLERIRRHYPELVSLVKKEMLSGWGSTSPSSIRIKPDREETTVSPSHSGWLTKAAILVAVGFLSFVAIYIIRENRVKDLTMIFKDPQLSQAIFLYGSEYNVHFEAFMDRNAKEITHSLKEDRKLIQPWLPFLRAVAFHKDGNWDGLPNKILRGRDMPYTPRDCSLPAWHKRWEASKSRWQSFIAGDSLPDREWAKILTWDMEWVRQRKEADRQWVWPSSYYEGCLIMAAKALRKLDPNRQSLAADVLRSRLDWQLNLLRGQDEKSEFQMSGSLWTLSCVESSETADEVNKCVSSFKSIADWDSFMTHRSRIRKARLLIINSRKMSKNEMSQLESLMGGIQDRDPVSRFDYREEKRLYQTIMDRSGDIQAALEAVNRESKQFRFHF